MAKQGKQMRVGDCKGFAYRSVKLVSLAKGNRYEVEPIILSGKAVYPFNMFPSPNFGLFFDTNLHL
jgi:hypothetical protein